MSGEPNQLWTFFVNGIGTDTNRVRHNSETSN